jgi:uncharacterized paraquat-inducible protein A
MIEAVIKRLWDKIKPRDYSKQFKQDENVCNGCAYYADGMCGLVDQKVDNLCKICDTPLSKQKIT